MTSQNPSATQVVGEKNVDFHTAIIGMFSIVGLAPLGMSYFALTRSLETGDSFGVAWFSVWLTLAAVGVIASPFVFFRSRKASRSTLH